MQTKEVSFSGKYVLCLAEGAAEREVMDMLLELDLLPFNREDLVGKKIQRRMSVSAVEEKFLSLSYKKTVVILRIIDSRKESFKLRRQYKDRFEVITVTTHPEIEILLILSKGDYKDYSKTKSREKPSAYCSRCYGYKKNQDAFSSYIMPNDLVEAIKKYSKMREFKDFSLRWLLNI